MGVMDVDSVISDACAATSIDNNTMLGLRLGGTFGILFVSAFGVALPYFTSVARFDSLIFLLKAFAGGVVLATGANYHHFLQSTSSSNHHVVDPCRAEKRSEIGLNLVPGSDSNRRKDCGQTLMSHMSMA